MNFKIIQTSLALAASVMLSGCNYTSMAGVNVNNGNESDATVKKEIKIGEFDEVSVSQGIKVIFEQGKNTGIASIATTPSAEKYLSVTVKDKVLEVHYTNTDKIGNKNIKGPSIVKVSSPYLKEVDLSSAAMFELNGNYKSDNKMEVDMSSGSFFHAANIVCAKLKVDTSSGASANLSNFSGNINVEASSGSRVDIDKINAETISLDASSGAGIHLDGIDAEEVYADASSGAGIHLKGMTNKLKQSASSGGSVRSGELSFRK